MSAKLMCKMYIQIIRKTMFFLKVMTFLLLRYTVIVIDDDNAIVISGNCQLQANIATAYIHILLNAIITYKNMFPFLAFDILFCVLHNF